MTASNGDAFSGPSAPCAMEAYFGPLAATIEGAPRVLQQALESVEQCLARKRAQQPSVAAFLQAQPGAPIGGP